MGQERADAALAQVVLAAHIGALVREAADEGPLGSGASSRSLRRATSSSWSDDVEKKPPCSGSAKRSTIASPSARASPNQRSSNVAS